MNTQPNARNQIHWDCPLLSGASVLLEEFDTNILMEEKENPAQLVATQPKPRVSEEVSSGLLRVWEMHTQ